MNHVAALAGGPRQGPSERSGMELAKREWESAVDALPQLICVLDPEGRLLRVNRAAEGWGLPSIREARGASLHHYLHPSCRNDRCPLLHFWPFARIALQTTGRASYLADDALLGRRIGIDFRLSVPSGRANRSCRSFAVAWIGEGDEPLRRCDPRQRAYERLQAVSSHLIDVQEQERRRLASDLHDGLGQTLGMLRFGLDDACRRLGDDNVEQTRELLRTLGSKIEEAVAEVRAITQDLRPSLLDEHGLVAALSSLLREYQAIYRHIAVNAAIEADEAEIPPALKRPIYRIVQEALHNIAKHADHASVVVALARRGGGLELAIADSGNGFDVARLMAERHTGRGYGLISMRDRAVLSGGDYRIVSEAGRGTRVSVRWPLP